MKRIIVIIIVALLVWWVVTDGASAGNFLINLGTHLKQLADSVITFIKKIV